VFLQIQNNHPPTFPRTCQLSVICGLGNPRKFVRVYVYTKQTVFFYCSGISGVPVACRRDVLTTTRIEFLRHRNVSVCVRLGEKKHDYEFIRRFCGFRRPNGINCSLVEVFLRETLRPYSIFNSFSFSTERM